MMFDKRSGDTATFAQGSGSGEIVRTILPGAEVHLKISDVFVVLRDLEVIGDQQYRGQVHYCYQKDEPAIGVDPPSGVINDGFVTFGEQEVLICLN